ncbi:MAG: M28 family peptidase [Sphingobacteriales bacterium]|jgi:aminopeptidase YwaD|nr:M28 family peptidase [Sphingobacteriales bacterium]MBP9140444.1 M28 family peptidase [Chitinophagales bacterium]MDA0197456.1 M28 family peptidase [Bacteroidota bacterium]MBK6891295.1 M28 family peptidase [Sphingobacteriales bacterium]MBK7526875.1 M28 family peptidase [Sphingobacteriales bacterium]
MRFYTLLAIFTFFAPSIALIAQQLPSNACELQIENYRKHVAYLASDALEGRGTGSAGEAKAAEYIAQQYKEIGLQPLGESGSFFQRFEFYAGRKYANDNFLTIDGRTYPLDSAYLPMPRSGNGKISGKIVDVGYGIIAPNLKRDDYANIKPKALKGRIALMRYPSPDNNPHSDFAPYLDADKRVAQAIERGAIGVIFVNNDAATPNPEVNLALKLTTYTIPVVIVKPGNIADVLLAKSAKKAKLTVQLNPIKKVATNVIALLDNKAPLTVVFGAHYDHLGHGEMGGSLYRGPAEIHNGADDNASGVATIIELARSLQDNPRISYNYLFIAFSGEELGLYGSNYYANNPTIPINQITAMVNYDMVGRLNEEKQIQINGFGTSPVWQIIPNLSNPDGLKIQTTESGVGPSDHTSFYLKNIPVLHFFTGQHNDYHKPSDDTEKVNFDGMCSIANLTLALLDGLQDKGQLGFTKTQDSNNANAPRFTVTLGVVPDYMFDGQGMKISAVNDDKPAHKAGLLAGDVVTALGKHKVTDMTSYMQALSQFKKGDATSVTFIRKNVSLTMPINF